MSSTRERVMHGRGHRNLWYIAFCLPALLVYVSMWVVPGIANIGISLTNWKAAVPIRMSHLVGLRNYGELARDPLFWNALRNNGTYAALTVVVTTVLSLVLAVLVERATRTARGLYRVLFFFPIILPWVVVAFLWSWIYNPTFGLINGLLKALNAPSLAANWLGDPSIALYAVVVVAVWKSFGFFLIIFVAGLQGMPPELEEAARIDGATELQTLFRVVLPLLRPIVGIVVTLILIDAFRVFDSIFIMTQGGPGYYSTDVVSTYIYRVAFSQLEQGYGSTLSVALFVVVAALSLATFSYSTRRAD